MHLACTHGRYRKHKINHVHVEKLVGVGDAGHDLAGDGAQVNAGLRLAL